MYEIGAWKIAVPNDVEIYAQPGRKLAELIPHSQYGHRFKISATAAEKAQLMQKAGKTEYILR